MSKNNGCPECGSTAKKHTEEDCDLAQAIYRDNDERCGFDPTPRGNDGLVTASDRRDR